MPMEELKKEVYKVLTTTTISHDDPADQFLGFVKLYTALCEQLNKAYSIGFEKGYEEGVNFSVKIKKN